MESQTSRTPVTIALAGAATFSALAYLMTLLVPAGIQPPFPVLVYLKFDPAEIVDLSSLLIFGPVVGIVTATVHFAILTATGGDAFGPTLKYLGVLSTYTGVILASRLGRHTLTKAGLLSTSSGILSRVLLMTVVNWLFILFIAQAFFGQNYLGFAQYTLGLAGISVTGSDLILLTLGLTAAYNAVHGLISIVGALVIVAALVNRAPQLLASRSWLTRRLWSTATSPRQTKPLTVQ